MSSKAIEKLLALAAEAERAAASYRLAAAALNGHAVDTRVARSATVLGDAIAIDAARRAPSTTPKPKRTGEHARMVRARRARTAEHLAYLGKHGPLTAAAWNEAVKARVGIAPLLNAGYIKAVGDKYQRTPQAFTVAGR